MPSVTREQVNKWNAKLQNGFRFDIQRYVVWGEKQIKKSIELADGRILTAEIHFRDARDGYKYIGNEACISLAIWTRCENSDMMKSEGMGYHEVLGAVQPKKSYADLVKLSAVMDEPKIMEMMNAHMNALNNPLQLKHRMKRNRKATHIQWDVDDLEDLELLPTEIDIPDDMTDMEEISDYITDQTGFCHKGFIVED